LGIFAKNTQRKQLFFSRVFLHFWVFSTYTAGTFVVYVGSSTNSPVQNIPLVRNSLINRYVIFIVGADDNKHNVGFHILYQQ
jgi:hypothetical protein